MPALSTSVMRLDNSAAADGSPVPHGSVCTGKVHPSDRIRTWVDAISRLAGQEQDISFKPLGDSFVGRLDHISVGNWRLSRVAANSHALTLQPVDRTPCAQPLLVVLQKKGSCTLDRGGSIIQVGAGEVAIAPLNASLTLVNEPYVEQYVLWTSRPLPGAQASDLTHMRRMSGQTAGQSLLRSMVETLFAGLATTPASAEFLAPALTWLLVQSLSEPSVAASNEAPTKPSREKIMRYVEDNLHDPEISPERIALAFGCSKRTLHRTFDSGSGDESLNRYLWRRRIERCAAELRSLTAASRRQTVTEIAYSFGFSSSAHFSRRFKQHIGVTPMSFRQVRA
jgi:AraC family transcriptional activator of tynA and feaB